MKKVEAIKRRGYIQEEVKICSGCRRVFSKDRLSYVYLCAECVEQLRSGKLETKTNTDRKKAMQTYLKVRNFVEKLENAGKEVQSWLHERLEKLHKNWEDARKW